MRIEIDASDYIEALCELTEIAISSQVKGLSDNDPVRLEIFNQTYDEIQGVVEQKLRIYQANI